MLNYLLKLFSLFYISSCGSMIMKQKEKSVTNN